MGDKMRILVVGESCIDEFIYGSAVRLAPEAPAPVVVPHRKTLNPGMAANVADNLRALGVDVQQLTNGNKILKTRYLDDKTNHLLLRVDTGDADTKQMEPISKTHANLGAFDAIVISDYCKGLISEDDILSICSMHDKVFIDTKKSINECFSGAKLLKINEYEYECSEDYFRNDPELEAKTIVTMGSKGCRVGDTVFPVPEVEVKDQVGAGDTFLSALVFKYVETDNLTLSINFANECASRVVSKRGVVSL